MKKIGKAIIALTCAATLALGAVGFVGCEAEKEIINAYDIAVKNGFQGTEEEWLLSLHGENGKDGTDLDIGDIYDKAVEAGYDGSFLEFVQEYLQVDMQENNDVRTIAENMSAVVSICAGFKKTSVVQSGWPIPTTRETVSYFASEGSGVIIDYNEEAGSALVLTNYHVVYETDSDGARGISDCIYLYPYGAREHFYSGEEQYDANGDGTFTEADRGDVGGDGIKAKFVGGALYYDIAILEVSGSEYLKKHPVHEAVFGDSESLSVGEKVFAIGNSNGFGISVTSGVLSVKSETITLSALDGSNTAMSFRVMRTDAAINHGNSGGALFDSNGKLIGITNAKHVEEETDALCYALPITKVRAVLDNLLDNDGKVMCAWLGIVSMVTASETVMNENGTLDIIEQVTVSDVVKTTGTDGTKPGAAMDKLKVGDIIKRATLGEKSIAITRNYYLNDFLLEARVGDTLKLTVVREGKETEIEIPLEKGNFVERG